MNKKVITVLTVGISTVILLGFLFIRKEPREPIIFGEESGSYPERSLDDLIYEADAVVIGKFDSAFPSQWNTPNGKLPSNATIQTVYDQNLYIYTEYTFQAEDFLKGEQPQTSIIIRTFGGQVGDDIMTVSSNESYEIGQTYLLFLHYDSRLAKDGDPGPFLIFGQRVYTVEDGKAISSDEWDVKELKGYIKYSPFATEKISLPNTPESTEIMQVVGTAFNLEAEAATSFDLTRFSDVFVNDPRFPINTETLEFMKMVTENDSLDTAGYLDYKLIYYNWWKEACIQYLALREKALSENRNITDEELNTFLGSKYGTLPGCSTKPTRNYPIEFYSIVVKDDIATVVLGMPIIRKELTLVLIEGRWYIAGVWGITAYERNSPHSIVASSVPNTQGTQEIIQTIEATYQDRILQFISIEVNDETATVYLYDGFRAIILSLTIVDGQWQITETKGI